MIKGGWKSIAFLGVTAVAVTTEVVFAFDGSDDTWPWTDLIVNYVPGEITMFALFGLGGWLLVHFGRRYVAKSKGKWDPNG
jgi:uncharacterized protein (DUF779 family)